MEHSGNPGPDATYWLAHCDGFQVLTGKKRLGFVQEVLDGGRTLCVRGGLLGRRVTSVPVDRVFAIVPRELRLWLCTSPTVTVPREFRPALADVLSPARMPRRRAERVAA
jgi:hypothetical protein